MATGEMIMEVSLCMTSFKIIYILLNFFVGVFDFSFYRIPNIILFFLCLLFAGYGSLYLSMGDILWALGVFAGLLAFGFVLFNFHFIGAGDAKYLAVAGLWVGLSGILKFLLIVSLAGGALSLLYLLLGNHMAYLSDLSWTYIQKLESNFSFLKRLWFWSGKGAEGGKRVKVGTQTVPYGIAIATGAIMTFLGQLPTSL